MSKNLANCTPDEFLDQTFLIMNSAEKFMKVNDILGIRSRKVEGLQEIPADNEEEAGRIRRENAKKITAQRMKNIKDILTSMMHTHKSETLELLALSCFIAPEDINNYSMPFFLRNLGEMLSDGDVLAFFTSLAQLEQTGIFSA